MSAGQALQASLVARLQSLTELSGIYDGPPARAPYPYLVVDCGVEQDWGAKDLRGREVTAALTLWDDQPARLQRITDAIEVVTDQELQPEGWTVVTWRFLRRRTVRDVAGPWAAAVDFRARLFAQS